MSERTVSSRAPAVTATPRNEPASAHAGIGGVSPPLHADDPRRTNARRVASGHSRSVRRLRWLLPAAALVIVGGFAVAMVLPTLLPGIDLGDVGVSSEGLVMANPKLSGHDGDRSYDITAERAVQSLTNPKLIELDGIDARISLPNNAWVVLKANHGQYDSEVERLKLSEGITLESSDGEQATFTTADIDLKTGLVVSDSPLTIDGPRGKISAGSAEATGDGTGIVFKDGVTLTLDPAAAEKRP
jgi:lipopolysaccharide export system protein LptC